MENKGASTGFKVMFWIVVAVAIAGVTYFVVDMIKKEKAKQPRKVTAPINSPVLITGVNAPPAPAPSSGTPVAS